jgi:phospholipase/carboxylesterase
MAGSSLPTHLVRRATDAQGVQLANAPLLMLLHGYGSNEEDLFGLEALFPPALTVVSLRAPLHLMSGSYAWFAIDVQPTGLVLDLAGARRALTQLQRDLPLLAETYGASQIWLLGFSQGAGMAAAAALALPDLVVGGALLSGITPAALDVPLPAASSQAFFVAHGTQDPVVPVVSGRATRDLLARIGAQVVYYEDASGHTISDACLRRLAAWVEAHVT